MGGCPASVAQASTRASTAGANRSVTVPETTTATRLPGVSAVGRAAALSAAASSSSAQQASPISSTCSDPSPYQSSHRMGNTLARSGVGPEVGGLLSRWMVRRPGKGRLIMDCWGCGAASPAGQPGAPSAPKPPRPSAGQPRRQRAPGTSEERHVAVKQVHTLDRVVIRFAGDSGDGMRLTGDRFPAASAVFGNDISPLPNFPAEIRAPQGSLPGVSSFQLHFANYDIMTPGDRPDVLVAMNPAALKANIADLPRGGVVIADTADFTKRNLAKVGYASNPLEDDSLTDYQVHALDLTGMTVGAVKPFGLSRKDASRAKNMFALGLLSWLYHRPTEGPLSFLSRKFAAKPDIRDANVTAFKTGYAFGETTEVFAVRYEVAPAPMPAGPYRQINGNLALALGLVTAARKAELPLFLGAYPITPA